MIKRCYNSLLLIVVLSCSHFELKNEYISNTFESDNAVTKQQVLNYIQSKGLTKSSSYVLDYYTDSQQDTLMYIVNYGESEGWQILSSDVRVPPILAESSSGSFSMEDGSEGFRLWIAAMAKDMRAVRSSRDEELKFSEEEISANKTFWGQPPQRKPFPHESDVPSGQWYTCTYSVTEVVDTLPHITVTQWDQNAPYNLFCPVRTDDPNLHAYAGCTAIAGAQMLFFLHSKYGLPECVYEYAEHIGTVADHDFHSDNPSSTIWSSMTTTYQDNPNAIVPERSLIAYVGELISTEYQNDGSSASFYALKPSVLEYFGYNCSYATYNDALLKNCLLGGDPVLVSAYSNRGLEGHSFLIDGYKRTRIHTITEHYYRTSDGLCVPGYTDYKTHSYSDPEITSVKMNWGWWSQWKHNRNDGWYTLTGEWTVLLNGSNHTYQQNDRSMIYNFSVSTD